MPHTGAHRRGAPPRPARESAKEPATVPAASGQGGVIEGGAIAGGAVWGAAAWNGVLAEAAVRNGVLAEATVRNGAAQDASIWGTAARSAWHPSPAAPEPAAIALRDVSKVFGSGEKPFTAVSRLSLEVPQGQVFGLLGPNGSGKTTTISMISGLIPATSGSIEILGMDIHRKRRRIRQLLGTVPQETALYEELTAWANMSFHADLYGVPRREKKARITRLLQLVSLADRKDSRVGTFSGGMKRRLAIARALLVAGWWSAAALRLTRGRGQAPVLLLLPGLGQGRVAAARGTGVSRRGLLGEPLSLVT